MEVVLNDPEELAGFYPADLDHEDWRFYMTMSAEMDVEQWIVLEHDRAVGFVGVYAASWGNTAFLVASAKRPRFIRSFLGLLMLIVNYYLEDGPLFAHCRPNSKGARILTLLGFEFDTYVVTADEILDRYKMEAYDGS